ncbi:hypothetical protein [Streptomyces sp. NPDC060027]|uniref:hypothetical protein n=1 Tax=Streptomyces sp. NPDC060027 TaxID=3347040 RepID=UPI0036B4436E
MSTVLAPRPLADLEQDDLVRVEQEMARRARGVKPWTPTEYVDAIAKVHARYSAWRVVLQKRRVA